MVYFGEVGLSGEVRQVAQAEARLKEAQKLGFEAACLPRRVARGGRKLAAPDGLRLDEIGHLTDLVAVFAGKRLRRLAAHDPRLHPHLSREGPSRSPCQRRPWNHGACKATAAGWWWTAAAADLTQRNLPGMARIAAAPGAAGITLSTDGMARCTSPFPTHPLRSRFGGTRCKRRKLGRMLLPGCPAPWAIRPPGPHGQPSGSPRRGPAYARLEDRVSFADGFPVLVVNTASLDDLNTRLPSPCQWTASAPTWRCLTPRPGRRWWSCLHVGPVRFRGPKTCARCVVVTTDQTTGARPRDREPLRTLTAFRRNEEGRVIFGMT